MAEAKILVHVRFAADGSVTEIGERPAALTAQQWFDRLSVNAAQAYQPLSGGRAVFRMDRGEIDTLKASACN